jgi:hypothetical protein
MILNVTQIMRCAVLIYIFGLARTMSILNDYCVPQNFTLVIPSFSSHNELIAAGRNQRDK